MLPLRDGIIDHSLSTDQSKSPNGGIIHENSAIDSYCGKGWLTCLSVAYTDADQASLRRLIHCSPIANFHFLQIQKRAVQRPRNGNIKPLSVIEKENLLQPFRILFLRFKTLYVAIPARMVLLRPTTADLTFNHPFNRAFYPKCHVHMD